MSADTPRRRHSAVIAVALVFIVGALVWWAVRDRQSESAPRFEGAPVVKDGVTYQPVVTGPPEAPEVKGYAPRINDKDAALKAGRPVALPGPKGGKLVMHPVEPVPPPPGAKK